MAEFDYAARLRNARLAYIAAARRFDHALQRFDNSAMAMDPGPDVDNPLPWTAEQIQIIRTLYFAVRDVYARRLEWWELRRNPPYRPSVTPQQPHRSG